MSCHSNYVKSGDTIMVTGLIDNTGGQEDIRSYKVSFQDKRWRVSDRGDIRETVYTDHPLFAEMDIPVLKGTTK